MLKRRGVTSTAAIGILIVGLLIGAGSIYVATPSLTSGNASTTTKTTTTTTTVTGQGGLCSGTTVTIGALLDLSGSLKDQGTVSKYGQALAIQDINNWLNEGSCDLTFKASVQDDGHHPTTSLQQLQSLAAAGVSVVVGPLYSDAVVNDLSYADSSHIVMISPSSTAASLSIDNDYLFRTVPTDLYQGRADAKMMVQNGVQAAIIINCVGTYSGGLANATKVDFANAGGHIVDQIQYTTCDVGDDLTPVLSKMITDWNTAAQTYDPSKIAIYAVSFEELTTLLIQANASATYRPLLNTVQPWYGDDGQAQDAVISDPATAGYLMAQIRMQSTVFAPSSLAGSTREADFSTRFQQAYGRPPTIYGEGAYDDTWIAALSVLAAGKNDGPSIQKVLPGVADNYFGVTGWTLLGPSGDEIPLTGYQIWAVTIDNTKNPATFWIQTGGWDVHTNTVTWTRTCGTGLCT